MYSEKCVITQPIRFLLTYYYYLLLVIVLNTDHKLVIKIDNNGIKQKYHND